MAIVPMKKIDVLGLKEDRDALLRFLQRRGCVEISESDKADSARPSDGDELEDCRQRLERTRQALGALAELTAVKSSFFPPPRGAYTAEELLGLMDDARLFAAVDDCGALRREYLELEAQAARLKAEWEQLQPWRQMPIPLESLTGTRACAFFAGVLPLQSLEEVRAALAEIPAQLDAYGQTEGGVCVVAACLRQHAERAADIMRRSGFAQIALSNRRGTAAAALAALEEAQEQARAAQAQVRERAAALLRMRPHMEALHDALELEADRLQQRDERLDATARTFRFSGWVAAHEAEKLAQGIRKAFARTVVELREPTDEDTPPTLVVNSKLIAPADFMTSMFTTPDSRELDPNASVMFFYFIFFGMMVSDAAYGIVMTIGALLVNRFMQFKSNTKKLVSMMVIGGISTVLWGSLFGGWLGLPARALWFNPMEQPLLMLGLCFALGMLQIFWGMALQAALLIRAGKWLDAIFDVGFWYMVLIGVLLLIVPAAAKAGQYMAITGAIGLVLTQGRHHKNIIKRLLMGLLSLYNITGIFSDVLSYSRLFALGLATGVIAMVINEVLKLLLGIPILGYVLVAVIGTFGHLFNMAINVLGAYVHTSRLQYVEFFGRFLTGNGKRFEPLSLSQTRYVDVSGEEISAG